MKYKTVSEKGLLRVIALRDSPETLEASTFGLFARDRIYRTTIKFAEFEQRFGPWNG